MGRGQAAAGTWDVWRDGLEKEGEVSKNEMG
eukprot:COSAG02_NODE_264_length_26618_cov_244.096459_1_plen_30_part_10